MTGGEFTLGSPFSETFHATDEPQRRVEVKPFLLGETEVTLRQWQAVMGAASGETGLGSDYPVQSVRWHRAIEFLNRLSEREGKTPCYAVSGEDTTWNRRCDGYRLPSELEFEYALRAGTTTAYSFGDGADLATYAWFAENASGGPHEVRQRKPNPWGFYDMHGNVWEWVWDYYAGSYPTTVSSNYAGPTSGQMRVLRGGSFDDKASKLRSANRAGDYATRGGRFRGLRIASNR